MGESQFQKVLDGIDGAALMGVHILLPFLHAWRMRWFLEPIASVMDFKMLKGVRQRAEAAR